MNTVYTADSLSAADRLCNSIPTSTPLKSAIASMMAETFINGMNVRDLLDAGTPQQQTRT